jgi:hypothetical protein
MNLDEEAAAMYRRDSLRLPSGMMRRVMGELFGLRLPEALKTLSQPILAVAGDQEAAMIRESLPLFAALPTGTARMAPGGHHPWNAEFPDLFAGMIGAWVSGAPLPDGLVGLSAEDAPA